MCNDCIFRPYFNLKYNMCGRDLLSVHRVFREPTHRTLRSHRMDNDNLAVRTICSLDSGATERAYTLN